VVQKRNFCGERGTLKAQNLTLLYVLIYKGSSCLSIGLEVFCIVIWQTGMCVLEKLFIVPLQSPDFRKRDESGKDVCYMAMLNFNNIL